MRRIVGLLICGWAGLVNADCPTYRDLNTIRVEPALVWVEREMERCADDSVAAGLYGGLLLREGQLGEALIWLEKSLLLDPDQPGVAADYALGLASMGESDASSALAEQVLLRNDIPENLETLLDDLVSASFWEQGVQLSVGIGVSDNILFEPDLEALELTFGDDGVAQVPLAVPSVPETRGLMQQSVQWSGRFSRGEIEILPSVGLSLRRAGGSELADYRSLSSELRVRQGSSEWGLGLNDVSFGGDQDREEFFVSFEHALAQREACELVAKVKHQRITYVQPLYDASRIAAAGKILCAGGWTFDAEIAQNYAVNERAGGDKFTISVAAEKFWSMELGSLRLAGRITEETDREAYSEFLARGAPRTIHTFRMGAVWEVPLNARWALSSQVTRLSQKSNINLFNVSASEIVINMIYTF